MNTTDRPNNHQPICTNLVVHRLSTYAPAAFLINKTHHTTPRLLGGCIKYAIVLNSGGAGGGGGGLGQPADEEDDDCWQLLLR